MWILRTANIKFPAMGNMAEWSPRYHARGCGCHFFYVEYEVKVLRRLMQSYRKQNLNADKREFYIPVDNYMKPV